MRTKPHEPALDDHWREYFDSITADGHRLWVTVSLAAVSLPRGSTASIGGRTSRQGGLLVSVRYDRDRDEIELLTRRNRYSVHYFLRAPRVVAIEERTGFRLIRVRDASGVCTEITLAPLPLDELYQTNSGTLRSYPIMTNDG
jgi:hypothetical protein